MGGSTGLGAGEQDAEAGPVGVGRPHLAAADDPLVAVGLGPGGERGQVRAGVRLAEELAPDLLAGQHGHEVPLLLRLGAGVEERRARPADADGVVGSADAGPAQLVVDHQLPGRDRRRARRARPMRGHEPALGQLARRGRGVLRQPGPDGGATRIVVTGQCGVHAGQRRLPGIRRPDRRRRGVGDTERGHAGPVGAVRGEEPTVSEWIFADVWEVAADLFPEGSGPRARRAHRHLVGARPHGQRPRTLLARPAASAIRTRWRSTSTTAPSTSKSSTPASSAGWSRSTPTTATPTTSSPTCGTTPTRWRSSSTGASPSASSGYGTGCPTCAIGCGSTTAPAPVRRGRSPTTRPPAPPVRPTARDRCRPPGAGAPTTSSCSTPAGRRACPKASCGARTTSSPCSTPAACATSPRTWAPTGSGPRSRPAVGARPCSPPARSCTAPEGSRPWRP